MDLATAIITVALLGEAVMALVATALIVRWHAPLRGQARFLDKLVERDIRVAVAGGLIAVVIVYSLARFGFPALNLPPLVPPLGAILISIPLALMLLGPILDYLTIRRERKRLKGSSGE